MERMIKRIISLILTMLIVSSAFSFGAFAAENDESLPEAKDGISIGNVMTEYNNYLTKSGITNTAFEDMVIDVVLPSNNNGAEIKNEYEGAAGVVLLDEQGESISYSVNVPADGLYSIKFNYLPLAGNALDINFALKINGEYPFPDCKDLYLKRMWKDSSKPNTDDIGNQFASEQAELGEFVTKPLCDDNGIVTDPYEFALKAGLNELTIELLDQGVAFDDIILAVPERAPSYKKYLEQHKGAKDYTGKAIEIEGEKAVIKGSRSLVAKSDNGSADITPNSPTSSKLNYIGGSTWNKLGAELSWKVNVPESGFYNVGFSFKQNEIVNGTAYRWLKVDGKTPFEEAKKIGFSYDNGWQFNEWADNEKNYKLYLEKGKRTISLDVTLAGIAPLYTSLKDIIFDMGQLYLDIIKITGESPDANRDYDLFKQIPDFNDTLSDMASRLEKLIEDTKKATGEESNQYIAAYQDTVRVINQIIDNPYTAQIYVNDFYTQYTSLGSWLSEMIKMPLSLDQIQLFAPDKGYKDNYANFFEEIWFGIKRFFISFSEDYSGFSTVGNDEKQLKIWVNWGRDQAQVLSNLIQQSFTPKTGIKVKLELTPASVIKGMMSNTQPDLQLHMSRSGPVDYAMRGALYDLTKFSDFEQVTERFIDSATVPYEYNGGVYALPDTQNFYLMFYRTDIFEDLGLKVPETWDEFLDCAGHINRNNMTVHLPYTQITATTTVNAGVGGLNLYASILQQFGGSVYNDKRDASTLEEPIALKAFNYWTQMYTKFKIPTTQSFYNRFKVGTTPLGIEVYTQYTQIDEAAPEIDGCWGIALVPGVRQEDGSVNRSVSGSGSACAILKKSKHPKEAWEFLKWWTSAETQLSYNNNVESVLGTISRTTTATVEAFEQMSWEKEDLKILLEQRNQIVEVPEIPGSYYLTRAVDQAFWQVIEKSKSSKDALTYWGKVANKEIDRKIKQYS